MSRHQGCQVPNPENPKTLNPGTVYTTGVGEGAPEGVQDRATPRGHASLCTAPAPAATAHGNHTHVSHSCHSLTSMTPSSALRSRKQFTNSAQTNQQSANRLCPFPHRALACSAMRGKLLSPPASSPVAPPSPALQALTPPPHALSFALQV